MKTPYMKRFILGLLGITAVTLALRFIGLDRLYDIHIDEVTYDHFAATIAAGHLPLLLDGRPFFLHPPGYFALLALWRDLVWRGGDLFSMFNAMRGLNVVLAGMSAMLIGVLTRRLTGSVRVALAAAAVFALDPFTIRHNTRSLMETATMMWMLAGLWLMLRAYVSDFSRRRWLLAGFVFGLAVVTKDVAGVFLVIALFLMLLRGVAPERRAWKYFVPAVMTPYALWIGIVAASGFAGQFFDEKTRGLRRFLGLLQETGYNSAGAPSKAGTLLSTLVHYAPSYAIMGLGALGAVILLTSKDKLRRWWGTAAAASTLVLGYTFTAGAMEEQYLYYLLVPSVITVAVAAVEIVSRSYGAKRHFLKIAGIVLAVALMVYSAVAYGIAIRQPDDGWRVTSTWVYNNLPSGSSISVFGQGQFFFDDHDIAVSSWHSMADLKSHHVGYIVISDKLSNLGYTPLSPEELKDVYSEGTTLFSYTSRDSGTFHVVKLPAETPALAEVPAGSLPDTGAALGGTAAGLGSILGMARLYLKSRRSLAGARRRVSLDRWR